MCGWHAELLSCRDRIDVGAQTHHRDEVHGVQQHRFAVLTPPPQSAHAMDAADGVDTSSSAQSTMSFDVDMQMSLADHASLDIPAVVDRDGLDFFHATNSTHSGTDSAFALPEVHSRIDLHQGTLLSSEGIPDPIVYAGDGGARNSSQEIAPRNSSEATAQVSSHVCPDLGIGSTPSVLRPMVAQPLSALPPMRPLPTPRNGGTGMPSTTASSHAASVPAVLLTPASSGNATGGVASEPPQSLPTIAMDVTDAFSAAHPIDSEAVNTILDSFANVPSSGANNGTDTGGDSEDDSESDEESQAAAAPAADRVGKRARSEDNVQQDSVHGGGSGSAEVVLSLIPLPIELYPLTAADMDALGGGCASRASIPTAAVGAVSGTYFTWQGLA